MTPETVIAKISHLRKTLACGKRRRSRSAGREEDYGRPGTALPASQTA